MLTAAMKTRPVQSVRFDKTESPPHINDGEGWTVDAARDWCVRHELSNEQKIEDATFIRFNQFAAGRPPELLEVEDGVTVLRCEK